MRLVIFSFLIFLSACTVVVTGDTIESEVKDGNLITTARLNVSVITPVKQMRIPRYNEHKVEVIYFY